MIDVQKAIAMIEQGLTEKDAAYRLGATLWGLKLALYEAGFVHRSKRARKVSDELLVEARAAGKSYRQIATKFEISPSTVRNRLEALRVQKRTKSEGVRLAVMDGRGPAKINMEKLELLRALDRDGESDAAKAAAVGLSRIGARAAADGDSWGYVAISIGGDSNV